MQEIADWLRRLGLPDYAGAFAENGIDVSGANLQRPEKFEKEHLFGFVETCRNGDGLPV
jgi:SAM domain (Sterile alpha motif)